MKKLNPKIEIKLEDIDENFEKWDFQLSEIKIKKPKISVIKKETKKRNNGGKKGNTGLF